MVDYIIDDTSFQTEQRLRDSEKTLSSLLIELVLRLKHKISACPKVTSKTTLLKKRSTWYQTRLYCRGTDLTLVNMLETEVGLNYRCTPVAEYIIRHVLSVNEC